MDSSEPLQVFVRNDKGKVWGPISLQTVELLIDAGALTGRLQVSKDGVNFAFPGRFPFIRKAFPRELWGDVVAPGDDDDFSLGPGVIPEVVAAASPTPGTAPPVAGPGAVAAPHQGGVPAAGPGAVAAAQRPVAPVAGPGAVAAAQRPASPAAGPGAIAAAQRATVPVAGPGAVAAPQRAAPPAAGPGAVAAAQRPVPPVAGPGAVAAPQRAAPPVAGSGAAAPHPGGIAAAQRAGHSVQAGASEATGAAKPPAAVVVPPAPSAVASPPAPSSTAMPSNGSLSAHSPVHLYYLAAANELTGLLSLELSDRTIEVHFRKGNPEYVGSSHVEDSLPSFLLKHELATAEQIAQAESQLDRFGGELVAALFSLGILNPGTAFRHLIERAQSLLLRGLVAEHGSFRFDVRELPPHKVMPLGNKWGVLTELVRRIPAIELKRRLQPFADKAIMKSGGLVQLSELRLTPQETRVLPHIDGVRSLDQLCQAFPQDADHFIRMGFLLKELEAVSFSADPVRTAPPPPPPKQPVPQGSGPKPVSEPVRPDAAPEQRSPPAVGPAGPKPPASGQRPAGPTASGGNRPSAAQPKSVPASAPPKPPVAPKVTAPTPPPAQLSQEQEMELLRSTLGKMREQNLFEVLGLTDKADANAVKLAYLKLAKTYHPDTLPPDAPAELAKLKADIFARIGEAYRTLSDDKARANYLEELKSGGAQFDVAQILAAEEMFQKGCVLVRAKKFADAVAMLDEAIKNNPEEGEFYAWRGYAKFFANTDRREGLAAAQKDFDACLKKNPRCAQAYYFQGHIARLVNDVSGAAKHFKKCLELNPQHIDAQRELRLMKK